MPLLNPNQIHEVLRNEERSALSITSETSLEELLTIKNLSREEVLDSLRDLMRFAENDSIKLQATKLAVELNKMIDKSVTPNFSCTIVIRDSTAPAVNPILIPRKIIDVHPTN